MLRISLTAIATVFHTSSDGTKSIVMGADGLDTITFGEKEAANTGHRKICKIRSTDGFYYAMSGLRGGGPGGTYDAYKVMERALGTPGDFTARTARLEAVMGTILNGLNAPVSDRRIEMMVIDSSAFPLYYFGVIDRDSNGTWSVRSGSGIREGPLLRDKFVGVGIGPRAAQLQSRLMVEQPSTIREMLQQESLDRPGEVGEPFSIIRITEGHAEWLERGACGDSDTMPVKNLKQEEHE